MPDENKLKVRKKMKIPDGYEIDREKFPLHQLMPPEDYMIETGDGRWVINPKYLKRKKQVTDENKFKIGTEWKTRGGWRAVVVKERDCSLLIFHDIEKEMGTMCGHDYGGRRRCHTIETDYDLIEPWKEPRKGECWVNIFENRGCMATTNKRPPEGFYEDKMIAQVKVQWTEGQFDE